mgnify:CR=1 FL=1
MENVIPAGVIAFGYILDISACVIRLIRRGDPGVDTNAVKTIVTTALMIVLYFIIY